jgi:hypothetical protein
MHVRLIVIFSAIFKEKSRILYQENTVTDYRHTFTFDILPLSRHVKLPVV